MVGEGGGGRWSGNSTYDVAVFSGADNNYLINYDILNYDVDASFDPGREWIDGLIAGTSRDVSTSHP